jgi:RNA polymerase sigma-70 factor (ECF subfamily)
MRNQEQIQELIDRSKQNDTAAFAQLVSEFQMMVFRLAFRLLCDEDETRDMVQDVFVKIWLSIDKYDGSCRFSTWIYKIACNTCYDRLRTLHRSPSAYSSDAISMHGQMASEENIEEVMTNRELKDLILRFTEQLSPKQKLVFTLRDIEGLEVSEVVIITGMTAEKVKHNLYQARKQIRTKIHQIDPDL